MTLRYHAIGRIATVILAIWPLAAAFGEDPPTVPPPETWIVVKDIADEYAYVRQQRSAAGGRYEVIRQCTGVVGDRHYDQLFCKCEGSDQEKVFTFDVTSVFEERAFADSEEAREKAHRELDRRYTQVTDAQMPDLKQLLKDKNPHYRTWAIAHLAALQKPEADAALVDAYLRSGILESWKFLPSLTARGDAVLPLIEERLRAAKPDIPWSLLNVLEGIPTERSARILEEQLRHALRSRPEDRRACYMALGEVGNRGSAEVLLEALRVEWPEPDDALVWAIGRCEVKQAVPRLRELLDSSYEHGRLAAIAALGALGDRESVPRLREIAEKGETHNARHNAIFALGKLGTKEAVPLLLEYLRQQPKYESHYSPIGLFGREAWTTSGNYIETSVNALARIGDERAVAEFRRILKDDRYYLNYQDVSEASAQVQWGELVPDIVERFEKDYAYNVEWFGKDHERYSPALRKLTGQSFGEDPQAWRKWLQRQKSSDSKSTEPSR